MAEALTSVTHALKDITECPICCDVYTDPRSLPCIHTYCLKCISKWFEGKRPKDSVCCPLCRKEFEIPSNGLVELPKNIFIGKFLTLKELAGISLDEVAESLSSKCDKHTDRGNVIEVTRFADATLETRSQSQSQRLRWKVPHTIPAVNNVWTVAALGEELFAATGGPNITVYDTSTCQQTRQFSIQNCSAFGLATCATNRCLYVSDRGNCKIHKVSLPSLPLPDVAAVFPFCTAAQRPAGLAINRSHNLLVACDISRRIQEFSSTGSLIREVSVANMPWHAAELHDGKLFVITRGPVCRVSTIMSVDGRVLRSYKSKKTRSGEPEQAVSASSLAVDDEGSVFIADYPKNSILVFKPESTGELCRLSVTINPLCVWFDESRGQIYVGEFSYGAFVIQRVQQSSE